MSRSINWTSEDSNMAQGKPLLLVRCVLEFGEMRAILANQTYGQTLSHHPPLPYLLKNKILP